MIWQYEKFKGDSAIYAFCPKCGFHHCPSELNCETWQSEIRYQYNYCPMCGEYLHDENFENEVKIIWNERDIEELYELVKIPTNIDEETLNKSNSIGTSFQMTPSENVEYGHWIYWDGWIGNSCQRIDDAVCSNCGYKHPTVYWTKGDEHNSTPNKLADICPNCKAIMNKWGDR